MVACGTSIRDDSECNIASQVLSVTVSQQASSSTCEYQGSQDPQVHDSKRRSIASGHYGTRSSSIWVNGTCIGIFSVCTGKLTCISGPRTEVFVIFKVYCK